jgi:hypothetical protein
MNPTHTERMAARWFAGAATVLFVTMFALQALTQ